MKLFYFFSFITVVVLCLGNSSGAGLVQNRDLTGSPLSTGTCLACHGGGNFDTNPVIELLDNGTSVTEYIPGQTYTMRLTINTMNFPAGFGFQLVSLDSANMDAGSFGTAGSGTRLIAVNNRTYFEHTNRITEDQLDIEWTAPAAGSGDVDVFAAANAVNGNGAITGDHPANTSVRIAEAVGSATTSIALSKQITLFPNPAQDELNLDLSGVDKNVDQIEIYNAQGQLVMHSTESRMNVAHLPSGMYMVSAILDDIRIAKKFMKL